MTHERELRHAATDAEVMIEQWDGAPLVVVESRADLMAALDSGWPPLVHEPARALTKCVEDRSGWPPDMRDAVDRLAAAVEAADRSMDSEKEGDSS